MSRYPFAKEIENVWKSVYKEDKTDAEWESFYGQCLDLGYINLDNMHKLLYMELKNGVSLEEWLNDLQRQMIVDKTVNDV